MSVGVGVGVSVGVSVRVSECVPHVQEVVREGVFGVDKGTYSVQSCLPGSLFFGGHLLICLSVTAFSVILPYIANMLLRRPLSNYLAPNLPHCVASQLQCESACKSSPLAILRGKFGPAYALCTTFTALPKKLPKSIYLQKGSVHMLAHGGPWTATTHIHIQRQIYGLQDSIAHQHILNYLCLYWELPNCQGSQFWCLKQGGKKRVFAFCM